MDFRKRIGLAALAWIAAGAAGPTRAEFLDPNGYASLGTFSSATGGTITTDGTPTLSGPNGPITGIVTPDGIAVFDFDSIALSGGAFTATGSRPVALLSRGNVTIDGTASVSVLAAGGAGGMGGSGGDIQPPQPTISPTPGGGPGGGGASDPAHGGPPVGAGGGGGGFGGSGGGGYAIPGTGVSVKGGLPYGDLQRALQGGSGGGGGPAFTMFFFDQGPGGGQGGGAIEIGALGGITLGAAASLRADGLNGGSTPYSFYRFGGGGGSGGGILLHADSVEVDGLLSAQGGDGGNGSPSGGSGGGGGGGRVLIAYGSGGFNQPGTIAVTGGYQADSHFLPNPPHSQDGVVTVVAVPEPSGLLLLGLGLGGALSFARRRARPPVLPGA